MTTAGHIKPNQRRQRESGWQRNNRLKQPPALPETPCKFHLFLYGLGISESQVRGSLSSELRRKVIEWARKHADSCYIPTWLLQDCAITTRYDS